MEISEHLDQLLSNKCFSNFSRAQWNNLHYLWTDYIDDSKKVTLSKYLLCPVSMDEWLMLHKSYDQFVADVVEPVYYTLHNDICWNLYFVVILSDADFQDIDYHTRNSFEINTEYTRNLIIKDSQLSERIPVGHILMKSQYSSVPYPVADWLKVLKNHFSELKTLSTSCFQELSSMCGFQYSDHPFPSGIPQHEPIFFIESAYIPKKFRAHLYHSDLEINCRKANLLVGANGAGKTSVLSAIELAMTGFVRKQRRDDSDTSDLADVFVKLRFAAESKEKSKPLSLDERRQRAVKWYNYTDNCATESLNSLFHCINYFSIDNAHRFVASSIETSDILSKTILGSETSAIWNSLKKLKMQCGEKLSELKRVRENLEWRLSQLPDLDEALDSSLWDYIKQSGIRIEPKASPADVLLTISNIEFELAKVSEHMPFGSQDETAKALEIAIAKLSRAQEEFSRLKITVKEYEQKSEEWNYALQRANKDFQETRGKLNAIAPLETMRRALSCAVLYSVEIERIRSLQAELDSSELDFMKLSQYYNEFKKLSRLSDDPNIQDINEELQCLRQQKATLEGHRSNILEKIAIANRDFERKERLIEQICEAGRALVENSPTLQECPLCGTKGIPQKRILQHLQENHSALVQSWTLEDRLLEIEDNIKRLEKRSNKVKRNACLIELINHAYQIALDKFSNLIGTNNESKLSVIHIILKEYQLQNKKRTQAQAKIFRIQNRFMTDDADFSAEVSLAEILSAEDRIKDILHQNGYEISSSCSSEELQKCVFEIQDHLTSTAAKQENAINSLKLDLEQISNSDIFAQYEKSFRDIEQLRIDVQKLSSIKDFWDRVSYCVSSDVDMGSTTLKSHCKKISTDTKNMINYAKLQEEKSHLEAYISEIRQEYNKYEILFEKLNELKSPAEYSVFYIQENIQQISQIFFSLHSPQEFTGLEIDEFGELFGLRKGKKVSINSMSAGQRTALVLSVFFQLHLANAIAPKFLLIDEPVLNIDDLNILSLMDFLREMVVNHDRQLFITTSNRNIAQLFRRKFSFLGPDFQRLNFSRENDSTVKITCQTYNQDRLVDTVDLY